MRPTNKLTALQVRRLREPGRYSDGGRLYLQIDERGNRSWVMMWKASGRRRVMGLGSANDITLQRAREKCREQYEIVERGGDPIAERRKERRAITFGEAVKKVFKEIQSSWRNAADRDNWRRSLEMHANKLFPKPVSQVDLDDIEAVLQPLWDEQAFETGIRLRARIERILDWCTSHKLRDGENPARWKLVQHRLAKPPKKKLRTKHYPALHYKEMPAFMSKLRNAESIAAKALEFAILTAARRGEVRGATWSEINLEEKTWTIPRHRMKSGEEHVVPLSTHALNILDGQAKLRISDFIFPGRDAGQPISPIALIRLVRRVHPGITVHGFRSSFRDRAGDHNYPREHAKFALAHTIGNLTEASYRRGTAFDQRRKLMQGWAGYCIPGTTG